MKTSGENQCHLQCRETVQRRRRAPELRSRFGWHSVSRCRGQRTICVGWFIITDIYQHVLYHSCTLSPWAYLTWAHADSGFWLLQWGQSWLCFTASDLHMEIIQLESTQRAQSHHRGMIQVWCPPDCRQCHLVCDFNKVQEPLLLPLAY